MKQNRKERDGKNSNCTENQLQFVCVGIGMCV